jgi:hypothetical protein
MPEVLSFQDPKGTQIELFREWSMIGNHEQVVGVGRSSSATSLSSRRSRKRSPSSMARCWAFRVSDWIGDFFVFMRCNADHHSVNFIRGKSAKMHHIAYELRDFSTCKPRAICSASGRFRSSGAGAARPGHNVAAFHRDHDDWVVEFYAELDQMKDEELGYFDPRPWHRDRPQRPKVWDAKQVAYMWGPPPTADFLAAAIDRRGRAVAQACVWR